MTEQYSIVAASLSFIAGAALLMFSFICLQADRLIVAPATTYSLTWGGTLLFCAVTPVFGFYYLYLDAVVFFVTAAALFSIASLGARFLFSKSRLSVKYTIQGLNFNRLFLFYNSGFLVVLVLLVNDLSAYGHTLTEISYNVRRASLDGVRISSGFVENYILFGSFCMVIFIYGALKQHLYTPFVLLSIGLLFSVSLVLSGRSGLVSLVLAALFVVIFTRRKIDFKWLLIISSAMLCVVYFGAILVKKIDIDGAGFLSGLLLLFEHIFDYLFQGPVLFSRYLTGEIMVVENWDALNSLCHIFSKINMCSPLPQHLEFENFGPDKRGNVYSLYFSIYPHYSYLGVGLFMIFYSIIITMFYEFARKGGVYSLVFSAFMFAALVLSVFKDGIGYALWMLIKFYLFSLFVILFFHEKSPLYRVVLFRKSKEGS